MCKLCPLPPKTSPESSNTRPEIHHFAIIFPCYHFLSKQSLSTCSLLVATIWGTSTLLGLLCHDFIVVSLPGWLILACSQFYACMVKHQSVISGRWMEPGASVSEVKIPSPNTSIDELEGWGYNLTSPNLHSSHNVLIAQHFKNCFSSQSDPVE